MAERTRSEYRCRLPLRTPPPEGDARLRSLRPDDRDAFARLLLDAYRGTIDDEGEELPDALDAADVMLDLALFDHSVVVDDGDRLTALSLIDVVDGLHYVDPVVVAADHKRQGLGALVVATSLTSLAAAGVAAVGATITDGNTASERLFASLGFERVGTWPRDRGAF